MAIIAPYVFLQELDSNGEPLAGGKVYTYEAGTSTPKQTFTDSTEATTNANPIILDASGRADIWLDTGSYKFVLRDADDNLIKTVDNITGASDTVFGNAVDNISTNYTVVSGDEGSIKNATASLTVSLLASATAGEGFIIGIKNSSSGNVTIDPDGLELIDGLSTLTVYPDQSVLVVCTGTAWLSLYKDLIALDQNNTFSGNNTFTGVTTLTGSVPIDGTSGSQASISLAEDTDNGTNTVTIQPPTSLAADYTLTLPDDDGDASEVLSTDGSGVLSWVTNYIRQRVVVESSTYDTSTTVIPIDNTIPQQSTEGELYLSSSFTPTDSGSTVVVRVTVPVLDVAAGNKFVGALFVDSTEDAVAVGTTQPTGGGGASQLVIEYEVSAASTSARTYKFHYGPHTSGTAYILGDSTSGALFGGIAKVRMEIMEYAP